MESMPIRPAFWNIPFWAEIGVYVVGLVAVIAWLNSLLYLLGIRFSLFWYCDRGSRLGYRSLFVRCALTER